MILRSLYDYAIDHKLLEDPAYEERPVHYFVRIGRDGDLLGIESAMEPDEKGKLRPKLVRVPRGVIAKRTSGVSPLFLCDKSDYVFWSAE
ncbi:MAG: type I-C CRISPR-associated protein Cas8c/Csd1 [Deltaproteobacteria bacterium]|nr:type I-C CRISPR-associated protein Cas8c/Csd1 [Deltaproteobacteria bacterium]